MHSGRLLVLPLSPWLSAWSLAVLFQGLPTLQEICVFRCSLRGVMPIEYGAHTGATTVPHDDPAPPPFPFASVFEFFAGVRSEQTPAQTLIHLFCSQHRPSRILFLCALLKVELEATSARRARRPCNEGVLQQAKNANTEKIPAVVLDAERHDQQCDPTSGEETSHATRVGPRCW